MVMDQLVMTGLFPAGSEEGKGMERGRNRRDAKVGGFCSAGSSKGYFFCLHQAA